MNDLRYLKAGLAVALCCSCARLEFKADEPMDPVRSDVIFVSLPDGCQRNFASGDRIDVYRVDGKMKRAYQAKGNGRTVEFSLADDAPAPTQMAFAVYPQTRVDSLFKGQFFMTLPTQQRAEENAVDAAADIYVGTVVDNKSSLCLVPAYVEFNIAQIQVASCTLSSETQPLGGPVKVVMAAPVSVGSVRGSVKAVTVEGELKPGCRYRAAILPGEYQSFNVTLRNSSGVVVWDSSVEGPFTAVPGSVVDLGNVGNPDASILEMQFSTSELAGYSVKSIVAYSVKTMSRVFGSEMDVLLEAGKAAKGSCFGVEPADYSGEDLWYLVSMEKEDDSLILPLKAKGPVIGRSAIATLDLGVLSESRNGAPWYYPHADKRLRCGEGYAFGDANTYFIQYKGSTYSGDADPDPSIPEEVVIDYRARGDFLSVPRPTDVVFEFKMGYGGNSDTVWGIYTGDLSKIGNGRSYTISVDHENYTVTVKNTGAHAQAPILLMKDASSGRILWAWAFWNVAADGTRILPVDFGGSRLCNLDIGQSSTQISKFIAKETELRRTTYYYQWGRPAPLFWQSTTNVYFSEEDSRQNATKRRMPVCDKGALSVAEALEHPGEMLHNPVTKGVASDKLDDWCSDGIANHSDLWGASVTDPLKGTGVKSIYDPCPKGWRVADFKTYADMFPAPLTGYSVAAYPSEDTIGYQGTYVAEGLLFTCSGYMNTNINTSPSIVNAGMSAGSSNTAKGNGMCWTNAFSSGANCHAFRVDYYYEKYDKATVYKDRTIGLTQKAAGCALPVRCQVDEDAR